MEATDPDSGSNGELTYSVVVKGNEDQLFDVRATPGGAEVFALVDFDRENPEFGFRRAGSKIVYPVTVKVGIFYAIPVGNFCCYFCEVNLWKSQQIKAWIPHKWRKKTGEKRRLL